MIHRIGITGSSCVGKTTLSVELAGRLAIPVAAEGAQEAAAASNIISIEELQFTNSMEFQNAVLDWKIMLEDACGGSFVSDRTVVDCAAYWIYRDLKGILYSNKEQMEKYFKKIRWRLENCGYSAIVFLESGAIEWQDDGFRTYDDTPISALILGLLHGEFRRSLTHFGTQLIFCPKEIISVENRVSFILEALETQTRL